MCKEVQRENQKEKRNVRKSMITVTVVIGLGLIGPERIDRPVGRPKYIDRALCRPKARQALTSDHGTSCGD
jgi:hypothetical protein